MTTEIPVMYGSEKVKNGIFEIKSQQTDLISTLTLSAPRMIIVVFNLLY